MISGLISCMVIKAHLITFMRSNVTTSLLSIFSSQLFTLWYSITISIYFNFSPNTIHYLPKATTVTSKNILCIISIMTQHNIKHTIVINNNWYFKVLNSVVLNSQ